MMKKVSLRISALMFALLLVCSSMLMVSAATGYLDDTANRFSAEEKAVLQQKLSEASEKTGWNIIVYTTDQGFSGDALTSCGERYLNEHGLTGNALLFVTDTVTQKTRVLTAGEVDKYFGKSDRLDKLMDKLEPYAKSSPKDIYGMAIKFADEAVSFYNMGKVNDFVLSLQKFGIFAGIAGVGAGVATFFITKSRYKNMGKSGTYDLAANSKVDLKDVEDTFVTQHTTVRTIQKDNDSGSSGGSTSSGHVSREI